MNISIQHFARALQSENGRLVVEGETLTSEKKFPLTSPEFSKATARHMERFKGSFETGFDPATRIGEMDEQGVDIQILYSTFGAHVLGREFRDPELLAASCAAYNDWSAEYCDAAPEQLRWAAMLPLQAPHLAIEEARRAYTRGCVGFYIRPGPVAGRNLCTSRSGRCSKFSTVRCACTTRGRRAFRPTVIGWTHIRVVTSFPTPLRRWLR